MMTTFFHGWQRKAGNAMLVMALALVAVWARSYVKDDEFSIYDGSCHSIYGRFGRFRRIYVADMSDPDSLLVMKRFGPGVVWVEEEAWSVHYWSIVIPLTLLSTYLLVGKPQSKPKATTESPPATA